MLNSHFKSLAIVSVVLGLAGVGFLQDQPDVLAKPDENSNFALVKRVEMLEQRVTQLESILFSTAKLTVQRAERQLAESKSRLENSNKLFSKGFITRAQVQQDEFDLRQAEQELKLAQTRQGQRKIVGDLEILEATQRLKDAERQLEYVRRLADRNFSTQTDVENAQRSVDIAKRSLENARLKLKAAEHLDSVEK